jgi:type VI secretion system protein VasJ
MLGALASPQRWQWVALGKHPVARDFFRLGPDLPIAGGFSDWVQGGYHALPGRSGAPGEFRSFRFWAKGPGKDGLVLGVVRDSSDDIGRPYPFFAMGVGPLIAWEEHWDLLPLACETAWGRIEYLSGGSVQDLRRMEVEITQRLRPPEPHWEGLAERRRDMGVQGPGSATSGAGMDLEDMERRASALSGQPEMVVSLRASAAADPTSTAALWAYLLRRCGAAAPNTVFLGGGLDASCLAVFRRALGPADFVRLWTSSGADEGGRP